MITKIKYLPESLEETKNQNKIVIFNDDVNTFDHVIDCLIMYCEHEPIQAEQCALIIHNNGRCEVKTGDYEDLKPMCSFLLEEGLSAQIE
jgi:ATP-dependent Clp protease adaptor protein ClpS